MELPEDLTPERLRRIADWFDIYDKLGLKYLELLEDLGTPPSNIEHLRYIITGTEIQDDLRRWADEIS